MNLIARTLSLAVCFSCLTPAQAQETLEHSPKQTVKTVEEIMSLPTRIAFGSCGHQNHKQPILRTVVDNKPDLFIYLADNIYGDTKDMNILKKKYAKLGAKQGLSGLQSDARWLDCYIGSGPIENDYRRSSI